MSVAWCFGPEGLSSCVPRPRHLTGLTQSSLCEARSVLCPRGVSHCWSSPKFVKSSQTHFFSCLDVSASQQDPSVAICRGEPFSRLSSLFTTKGWHLFFLSFYLSLRNVAVVLMHHPSTVKGLFFLLNLPNCPRGSN